MPVLAGTGYHILIRCMTISNHSNKTRKISYLGGIPDAPVSVKHSLGNPGRIFSLPLGKNMPSKPDTLCMVEKNLEVITYCGLCCLDCHGYTGKIAGLARDLRKELRSAQYEKIATAIANTPFGKPFAHYGECYELLGAMVKFRCKKGCRNGGGPPFCQIRKCCQKKEIAGCWECSDAEECTKLDFLKPVHGDGHKKNIRAIQKKGLGGFVAGKRNW
jgi:hypothetical protein